MGPDGTHTDAANAPSGSKRQARTATAHTNHRKRVRLTPTGSPASDPSFPDDSAMAPKRVPDGSTDASHADSESGSELEESSDEPSSDSESDEDSGEELQPESEDEEGIVNVKMPVKSKPDMRLPKDELGPDLRPFLESFLPRLKAANEALERERRAGTLKEKVLDDQEALDAQDQYIEMVGVFLVVGLVRHWLTATGPRSRRARRARPQHKSCIIIA